MSLTEISRKHFLLDIKMSSVEHIINFYNRSDCVFIIKLKNYDT